MGYLLDTSALSEPVRRQPRETFMRNLNSMPVSELFTSPLCIMELRYGCSLRNAHALWQRLEQDVLSLFTVLPFGEEEALRCGELLAELSKKGTPIGIEDTQIGATALVHGLTLVTFNAKHFQIVPNLKVDDWLDG